MTTDPIETMDFSDALRLVKAGERAARTAWRTFCGCGTRYIALGPGFAAEPARIYSTAIREEIEARPEHMRTATFLPKVMLRTPDGEFEPWHATSTDMLAADWYLVTLPVDVP